MRIKIRKVLAIILPIIIILAYVCTAYGYKHENGIDEATLVRLERVLSSESSKVGKVETITYNFTGDPFLHDTPKEIALVVDVSGSMGNRLGTKSRIAVLKDAVTDFVNNWVQRDCRICIVPFNNSVKGQPVFYNMKNTTDVGKLKNEINSLNASGMTNIGDGMRVAYHMLKSSGNTGAGKYIITLTDGEPNYYTYPSGDRYGYYTGGGITDSVRSDNSRAKTYCTSIIGNLIKETKADPEIDDIGSFVIGFATNSNLVTTLNDIGQSSGASILDNGNHHYYAGNEAELNRVYTDIGKIIDGKALTGVTFSEFLPSDTIIDPASAAELESQGFQFINCPDPDDPDNKVRIKIANALNDCLMIEKKYPDATASTQNITYQLRPYSFSVKIKYETPGTKVFKDIDASVDYNDPFLEVPPYKAYADTSTSVVVIQPVTGISKTDAIVMPNQNESAGIICAKVLPNVAPNIAYDESIASWELSVLLDGSGNPVNPGNIYDPNDVIELREPEEPNPFNNTKAVVGKSAGCVSVKAVSAGTNLDGLHEEIICNVYAVDAGLGNVTMNKGDIVNLNGFVGKCLIGIAEGSGSEEMTFNNWRLKNSSDDEYVEVDPSGRAEAVKSLEGDIPYLVDVDYIASIRDPGSSSNTDVHLTKTMEGLITVGQPVEDIEIGGLVLMAGENSIINAQVTPDDAYNTKIASWKYIYETGVEASALNSIAEFTPAAGDINNQKRNVEALSYGKLFVEAESEGYNRYGNRARGDCTIYVVDALCDDSKEIALWSTDGAAIGTTSLMPSGLSGSIKFRFVSSNPSIVSVNEDTGEMKALRLPESGEGTAVAVAVYAQHINESGIPVGHEKSMTCMVTVTRPAIDIN